MFPQNSFFPQCRERLHRVSSIAKEDLSYSQNSTKRRFDRKANEQQFQRGDQVLVLLPMPGSALTARFSGCYVVESKVSDTDYVILTPEWRRKTSLCLINMLNSYHLATRGVDCQVCECDSVASVLPVQTSTR